MKDRLLVFVRVLVVLLVMSVPGICLSADVTREVAQEIAAKFMQQHVAAHGDWGGSTNPFITDVETVSYENAPIAYNVKVNPSGHLLVPSHDEFSPVLLYSTTSDFIPGRINEKHSIESWIIPEISATYKNITRRGASYASAGDHNETRVGKAWRRLRGEQAFAAGGETPSADAVLDPPPLTTVVNPLLTVAWNQPAPYNMYAPNYGCSQTGNGNAYTGCVATAMAQVMKYWNWPDAGTGSHSYSWNGSTLSADFSHAYYWSDMPDTVATSSSFTQQDAVGRLMSDAGIAVNMQYGCNGSAAYISDIAPALTTYFKYKSPITQYSRTSYDDTTWFNLFKTELDAVPARPILFSIQTTDGQSGHEVVVDGYQTGSTNMVHINLGWGGSYTGWYDITHNFTTSSYTWSGSTQWILTNIQPNKPTAPTYTMSGTVHSGTTTGPAIANALVSIAGKSAYTSATGTFTISGIAAGTYAVSISATGYNTYSNNAYAVSANQSGLNFALTPAATGYTMSGTVHSGTTTGPAVANALVSIAGKSAYTSATGTFTISSIPAGTYALAISATGYTTYSNTAYAVGGNQSGLNFALTPTPTGYTMSGTVHSGTTTGPAVANAFVSIAGKGAYTSATGTFTISGITAGTYALSISATGYTTYANTAYSVSANQSGLNFALTPSYTMSGTVRSGSVSGPVIANALVSIAGKSVYTSSTGTFAITGIAAGTYPLTISAAGFNTYSSTAYSVGGNQSGLTFVLAPMYTMSGTVRSGSTTGPVIANALVSIAGKSAYTNSTGTFTITGIAAGTYPLTISATSFTTYSNSAYSVSGNQSGLTFTLMAASVFPNLTPYLPTGWSDRVVVTKTSGSTTDSSPLYPSDTLYVDWAVVNNSTVSITTGFNYTLYIDGIARAAWTSPTLQAGYYSYVTGYSIGTLSVGTHTIKIVADSSNTVVESNESDNSYTKTVSVVPRIAGNWAGTWSSPPFGGCGSGSGALSFSMTVNGNQVSTSALGLPWIGTVTGNSLSMMVNCCSHQTSTWTVSGNTMTGTVPVVCGTSSMMAPFTATLQSTSSLSSVSTASVTTASGFALPANPSALSTGIANQCTVGTEKHLNP